MLNNLTIYCCYHNLNQINDNNNLNWVYGPIDPLNKFFSEFSMFKWIYENDKDSSYIGCCHYRRQFNFFYIKLYYSLSENICITMNRTIYNPGIYSIKKWASNDWFKCEFLYNDWQDYLKTIDEYYKYNDADIFSYESCLMYSRCCFIMTKNNFNNLYKYVFGFFEYIDNKYKLNKNFDNYKNWIENWYNNLDGQLPFKIGILNDHQYRLLAFIGEWLVSNFITANFKLEDVIYLNDNTI